MDIAISTVDLINNKHELNTLSRFANIWSACVPFIGKSTTDRMLNIVNFASYFEQRSWTDAHGYSFVVRMRTDYPPVEVEAMTRVVNRIVDTFTFKNECDVKYKTRVYFTDHLGRDYHEMSVSMITGTLSVGD